MKQFRRLAGWAIILAAVLNLTRMVPVIVGRELPPPDFPLVTADELANFVSGNYQGHAISHLMAIVSFVLLLLGTLYLHELMKDHKILSKLLLISGILGFGLFFIAALIDGFVMSEAVKTYLTDPDNLTLGFLVTYSHNFAMVFFTPALFFIFLFISLSCLGIIIGKYQRSWLGWSGGILADVTIIAYLFGFLGWQWDNFPLSGLVIMLAYIWLLLLGIFTILGSGTVKSIEDSNSS